MRVRITEHKDGWRFQFIAANGEPQDLSEPYTTEYDASRGAQDLADNISGAPVTLDFQVVRLSERFSDVSNQGKDESVDYRGRGG